MENSTELIGCLVHLAPEQNSTSPYRTWLAEAGVLAAVADRAEAGPATLWLAARSGRPLAWVQGQLVTPRSMHELLTALTDAVGGLVEVPEHNAFVGDATVTATPPVAPPDQEPLLVSRATSETVAGMTQDRAVTVSSDEVDGWHVARFSREITEVGHAWQPEELPAVWVRTNGTVALQTEPGNQPQVLLRRLEAPVPVELTTDGSPEYDAAMAALRDPQSSSISEVWLVAQQPDFGHVESGPLAQALQSAPDVGWGARVLAELGLPSATHHPDVNAPADMLHALRDLDRAADTDPGAERLVRRLYGTSTRHPLWALSTIVPEILVGVALLVVLIGADERPWWHWLVGLFAVACLVDAAIDSTMMVARLRRHRGAGPR